MNSLEAEYSFLAPTWKLPTVATTSMYAPTYSTSYLPNAPDLGPDWSLWNNTTYNSRYIPSYVPSTAVRQNYPILTNYQPPGVRATQSGPPYHQQQNNPYRNNPKPDDGLNLTISVHPNNEYEPYNNHMPNYGPSQQPISNRGLTYSTPAQSNHPPPPPLDQKRRVKIIDHNRHTPSTMQNDYGTGRQSHNSTHEPPVSRQDHTSELNRSQQKSKPSTSNHHVDDHRRVSRMGNQFNIHEYLYGLAEPDPGSYTNAFKQQQRRLQDEKQGRKSVTSEYKTFAQNGGFGPTFGNTDYKAYGDKVVSEKKKKTYSKSVRDNNIQKFEEQKRSPNNGQQKNRPVPVPKYQRAREYADKIERPQNLKPVVRLRDPTSGNVIIRDASRQNRQRSETDSSILITSLSNNSRRSSIDSVHSLKLQRRVRFHSRDFIRHRSSTIIDFPSYIIGKGISNRTVRYRTKKSSSKILDEQEKSPLTSNKNEKKSIISHSMMTAKNMRLPPTATVVINPTLITTIYSKKSMMNKEILPSQRQLIVQSIPVLHRKSTMIFEPNFDLNIKSFHHDNKSSNE